jgi:tetratricopeptide (TPR) repeat protein
MNSSVLAALVIAALIVIALILKKSASQKKSAESRIDQQPAVLLPQAEEAPAEAAAESSVVQEEVTAAAATGETVAPEPAIEPAPVAEEVAEIVAETEEPAAPTAPPVTIAADALELDDLALEPVPVVSNEDLAVVEPETVAVDTSANAETTAIEESSPAIEPVLAPPVVDEELVGEVDEQDTAPEVEEPLPAKADEDEVPVAEPLAAIRPQPKEEVTGIADRMAGSAPGAPVLPVVRLTLDAYCARLNELEERQRSMLMQAIDRRDDHLRDRLQRELVIMNDKLALLADSYVEEVASYQQVLEILEQVRATVGEEEVLQEAIEQLQAGEAAAAEEFLANLGEQPYPLAGRVAYGRALLAESRVDLQGALELYRQAVEQEPDNLRYLQAAGRTARSLYNYKDALPWLESFVRLSRQSGGNDPLALALGQRELAYTYVLSGQYQKAGPLYKESMTVLARKLGQDHPEMATSWCQIGELQETLGEYDKAVTLYKKGLEILEKKRGPEHPVLANILAKLAALCMELEMEKEAVPLYERLVRIREKALRPTHPQLAISLNSLAESYRLQGRYAEAFVCYQKSLAINEALHGPEHPSVAAILQELAKLCVSQRKPEEAKQYQDRAAAIFQKSVEASDKKSGRKP